MKTTLLMVLFLASLSAVAQHTPQLWYPLTSGYDLVIQDGRHHLTQERSYGNRWGRYDPPPVNWGTQQHSYSMDGSSGFSYGPVLPADPNWNW